MAIFKRKCPHCLKAVPFRASTETVGASEERPEGRLKIATVACTSCGVVLGIVPQMGRFPEKRDIERTVRGIVRTHVGKAVKNLRRQMRRR